jgi:phosphoenolpyruvate carboxylase
MLRSATRSAVRRAAIASSKCQTTSKPTALQALSMARNTARPMFHVRHMSAYSSLSEPGTLFPAGIEPLSASAPEDRDAPLRADVRTMGSLLGRIIREHHGEGIFDKIEELRALAKKWREAGAGRNTETAGEAEAVLEELSTVCSKLSNEELRIVAKGFTHFLAIANAAEGHHRCRLLAQTEIAVALPKKDNSCGGVLDNLLAEGKTPEEIYESLTTQCVELVLTAHPTEVNRRTILEKHRRVQKVRRLSSLRHRKENGNTSKYSQIFVFDDCFIRF